MPEGPSLLEFAAERGKKTCRVCLLEERAEIDTAYNQGVSRSNIICWLEEVKGQSVTRSQLDHHIRARHHV